MTQEILDEDYELILEEEGSCTGCVFNTGEANDCTEWSNQGNGNIPLKCIDEQIYKKKIHIIKRARIKLKLGS